MSAEQAQPKTLRITYREAMREAIRDALIRDPRVFLMGEDRLGVSLLVTRMSLVNADERFPWPAASATGVGSRPGTDPRGAMAVVLGELPELPHLVELPNRGPGADLIGRTANLLVDLPVQTTERGWRLADLAWA